MFYPTSGGFSDTSADLNASQARNDASAARQEVDHLKADVERLLMITEALWQMVKEQHNYTDNELLKRIMEIDMRDGKLDGRVAPEPPGKCPHCDRPLFKARPRCIYCGEYVAVNPFQR